MSQRSLAYSTLWTLKWIGWNSGNKELKKRWVNAWEKFYCNLIQKAQKLLPIPSDGRIPRVQAFTILLMCQTLAVCDMKLMVILSSLTLNFRMTMEGSRSDTCGTPLSRLCHTAVTQRRVLQRRSHSFSLTSTPSPSVFRCHKPCSDSKKKKRRKRLQLLP